LPEIISRAKPMSRYINILSSSSIYARSYKDVKKEARIVTMGIMLIMFHGDKYTDVAHALCPVTGEAEVSPV